MMMSPPTYDAGAYYGVDEIKARHSFSALGFGVQIRDGGLGRVG